MKRLAITGLAVVVLAAAGVGITRALSADAPPATAVAPAPAEAAPSQLAVLWTSGDPDVAHRVCFMYTVNAKRAKWFDEVVLIIWGPSQRLLVADKDIQAKVQEMKAAGVQVRACIACAKSYGLVEAIRALDIEVAPMGPPLSDYLKRGWKVLTF